MMFFTTIINKHYMKKSSLISIMFAMFVATLLCVGITSCSSDDDNASIVGTWRCDWDVNCYTIITFNEEGTGSSTEAEDGKISTDRFRYSFDPKSMVLILMFWDDYDGDYTDYDEPAYVSKLTSKTMVIEGLTFVRQ